MKKKWVWILCLILLAGILFLPIPQSPLDDGGTREYVALTYKIVDWNRLTYDGLYDKTCVYLLPQRNLSVDELWESEVANMPSRFVARIIEMDDICATVEPMEWEWESRSSNRIVLNISQLEIINANLSDLVEITYNGLIRETSPAQIDAISWKIANDLRNMNYPGTWLDKETADQGSLMAFSDIVISEIYADCFFAHSVIPLPYEIKLNGAIGADWCVGDQVNVTYENAYYDEYTHHFEADLKTIEVSTFQPDPGVCYKPVIYLYPEAETDVSVKLALNGKLTCTYPAYKEGWNVTASPDGTLTDGNGQTYNYLYWEGETYASYDLSTGFCVKGTDIAAFLEDALARLGLTRREANEFIVYWLPLMEINPYNIITFQTDAYTDAAKLTVSPTPDTVIRVFMAWKASDSYIDIAPQVLTAPRREGFTLIEWGGTELK